VLELTCHGPGHVPGNVFIYAPEPRMLMAIMRPAAQTRIRKLMEQGFHKPGDVENRLGYYVGQLER
jgi:hypothetical protein